MNRIGPAVADCGPLGETRVIVPVRVAIGDLPVGPREPDNLGRQLEQMLEPASGGDAPAIELRRGERGNQQEDADDGDNQAELKRPEDEPVGEPPVGSTGSKHSGCHARVMHADDGKSEEE